MRGAGYQKCALLTDGRFSAATTGPCLGHVEMEAFNGGAIGAIRYGDIIEIDIPKRSLNMIVSDGVLLERLQEQVPPERDLTHLLESYRKKFLAKNCFGWQYFSLHFQINMFNTDAERGLQLVFAQARGIRAAVDESNSPLLL